VKFSSGFSVLEVLVGVAILSVVAVTMMSFSSNMSSSFRRGKIDNDADQLISSVQNLLNQTGDPQSATPAPCDGALLGPGGGKVSWDPVKSPLGTQGPVGSIVAPGGTVLAQLNQLISPNLRVVNMYLREPNAAPDYASSGATVGEGSPAHSVTVRGGSTFDTVVAKLVIEFDLPQGGVAGGGAAAGGAGGTSSLRRTADVVVAINQAAPHHVAFCFTNQPIVAAHKDCNDAPTTPGMVTPANDCQIAPGPTCSKTYRVQGFTQDGQPICVCNITCTSASITNARWTPSIIPQTTAQTLKRCMGDGSDATSTYNGVQCDLRAPVQTCVDTFKGCGNTANPPMPQPRGLPIQCWAYTCEPVP
jgi:type II secretory pathway pseudopilin PulG